MKLWAAFLVSLGGIGAGIAYVVGQYRKGSSDALEANNKALTDLLTTQGKEIDGLKQELVKQSLQINQLQTDVIHLQKENVNLGELILKALTSYFDQHPELADEWSRKEYNRVNK